MKTNKKLIEGIKSSINTYFLFRDKRARLFAGPGFWSTASTVFISLLTVLMNFGASNATVMPEYDRLSPVTETIEAPLSLALDQAGRLYVAESTVERVVVFSQSGKYLSSLRGLHAPISIAVDDSGRILIGSKDRGSVEVYDAGFTLQFKLGSGDGEFAQPADICVDSSGRIYVVDKGYDRVMMYDSSGRFVDSFGSPGNGVGQLHRPVSMSIDEAAGELVVLDRQLIPGTSREGARIQFFSMTGTYLRGFTPNGGQEGGLIKPQRIEVDGESRMYVTDSYQGAVLVYDSIGTFLGAVYDLNIPLRIPLGIAVDATNRLYVASRLANRIDVYGIDQYTSMVVDPVELQFKAREAGDNPASQSIMILNNGTATINWGAVANESWLGLDDEYGVLEPTQVASAEVAVDITGLAPGEYSGRIAASAGPGATEVVHVGLTIAPSAILSVTSADLAFAAETGTAPAAGTVAIANNGSDAMVWSISADQPWIDFDQASGVLTDSGAAPSTVKVTADVIGRAAGTYAGSITVTGNDAIGSPVSLPVSLTLTDPPVVEPPSPADRVFEDMIWKLRETLPPLTLNGVWAGSDSHIYAVGQAGTVLSYDGDQWDVMDSGTDRDLNGVWGSADPESGMVDVFAVGAGGTILHYDYDYDCCGSIEWTVIESSGYDLTGVWGTSGTDVYAVGLSGTVLHYNGTNWSSMDSGTSEDLYSVWGSFDAGTSKLDVYAVGRGGTILYYDGVEWSDVASPSRKNLYGVWGSSATDMYAVGEHGTMLHGSGSDWNKLDSSTKNNLNSIWGSSAADIYAVGSGGTILRYGGEGWTSMYSPSDRELRCVWGAWGTNVFAVGQDLTLLYYDYGSWRSFMLMSSKRDLNSVWGRSASDVFTVGSFGSILHYGGGEWMELESTTDKDLYSVWGRQDNTVFAVGEGGTILRYDGTTGWHGMLSPSRKTLYGVWGAAANDVFAVGQQGVVLHYAEGVWDELKYKGKENLYSVWSRSANDVYMVGEGGTILHYNGSDIRAMPSPTGNDLYGVRGCSDNVLFAVGEGGTFLQYVDSSWIALDSGTDSNLYDVWCSSEKDVFLVGQGDITLLYYDGSMRSADFGTGGWLHAIWGSDVTTDVFAVGTNGLIYHGKQ